MFLSFRGDELDMTTRMKSPYWSGDNKS